MYARAQVVLLCCVPGSCMSWHKSPRCAGRPPLPPLPISRLRQECCTALELRIIHLHGCLAAVQLPGSILPMSKQAAGVIPLALCTRLVSGTGRDASGGEAARFGLAA